MTAQRHAADAAAAIRALNHATLPAASGLEYPADACEITWHLSALAARLPQALAQILTFLTAEACAGRITVTGGPHAGDTPAMLTGAAGHLDAAAVAARSLHQALGAAQNALAWAGAASLPGG